MVKIKQIRYVQNLIIMIMLFLTMQQDKFLVVNIVFIITVLLLETPMEYVQQMTHHELFMKNSSKNIFFNKMNINL